MVGAACCFACTLDSCSHWLPIAFSPMTMLFSSMAIISLGNHWLCAFLLAMYPFLDLSSHLRKSLGPSVCRPVRPCICPSIRWSAQNPFYWNCKNACLDFSRRKEGEGRGRGWWRGAEGAEGMRGRSQLLRPPGITDGKGKWRKLIKGAKKGWQGGRQVRR